MDEQKQIEKYQLESFSQSNVYSLFPLLRTGIFHRTGIEGYRGIRQLGHILPNKGQFPYSYPQSKFYYGPSKGYVCLFDFESAAEKDCIAIHHTWGHFFSDHQPATVALRLNRQILGSELLPNSAAPKLGTEGYKSYIPYIEAWYPRPIPLAAVDGYILIVGGVRSRGLLFQEFTKRQIEQFEEMLSFIDEAWLKARQGESTM